MLRASVSALGCWLASAVLLGGSAAVRADVISDFYTGQTISILVGFGPGGGYDAYARTLGRHYGKHVPGNPNVVVKNVPGAAGMTLVNMLYNISPKDGTEFGTFDRTIPLEPLLDGSKSRFDPLKFGWIGSPSSEVSTCVGWHSARAKTADDLRQTEMIMAGTGAAADATIYPKIFRDILGLKFRVIGGYQGAADSILAMEKGEVEGFCPWGWVSIQSTRPDWLRDRKINILMQLGLRKDPAHPDVPLVLDLAKTDADRRALELVLSPLLFARPYAAPPGLARERLDALRKAFRETVQDDAFVTEAKKIGLQVDYVSDEDITSVLKRMYSTPQEIVDRVKRSIH
ncbi:hypothetical protein PY365_28555 [Roseiarcaceae bacterium H3SJ34-1]|uniref:Bug family tripartite tricarboxylate transporter substrate binding protein n=1 Tax=Terripilifer ovatus TaxID=3032367 RepID=UPI003AB9AE1D|nr:hypothetical protein [Roseiarcaceae bacterium H3SJ34-1]